MSENALADSPGIGHNSGSLSDQLAEELAAHKLRAKQLLDVAVTATIIDDESAGKCIDLAGLIEALEKELDAERARRKRPFLEGSRTIDGAYNPLIGALANSRSALRDMLTAYSRKRAAEAEAVRALALAEQRRREEEAEAAKEKARATTDVTDALASLKAQEEAAAAALRAEAIRPEPIRAQLGSLGSKREIVFTVTDYRKALGWLLRVRKTETQLALREIISKQLRSMGVDAVAAGVSVPGVEATIETTAAIRR